MIRTVSDNRSFMGATRGFFLFAIAALQPVGSGCGILFCRLPCESEPGSCDGRSIGEFPGFPETVEEARQSAELFGEVCREQPVFPIVAIGRCANGTLFVRRSYGFGSKTKFFDRDTEAFLGLRTTTDFPVPPCFGEFFWPVPIDCPDPVTDELLCGASLSGEEQVP